MPKNNKQTILLTSVLALLVGIYLVTDYYQSQRRSGSRDLPVLTQVAQEEAAEIILSSQTKGQEIRLSRQNENDWQVADTAYQAEASNDAIERFFRQFNEIKAQRIVSTKADRHADYSVNDSLGTRIQVRNAQGGVLADLYLGRSKFVPGSAGGGITYVRPSKDQNTYGVPGYISSRYSLRLADWRNQTVTRLNRAEVEDLQWSMPADSGFVLNRANNGWRVNAEAADSTKTVSYLVGLSSRQEQNFYYGEPPTSEAPFQLQINMRGSGESHLIRAWPNPEDEDRYILHSSMNQNAWFNIQKTGLFKQLFPAKSRFFSD